MNDGLFHWKSYFPYSIRPAQKEIVDPLYSLVKEGKNCVVEAANGTGKTIAALAATLPIAKKEKKIIVYMARTHSQMDRVIDELHQISQFNQSAKNSKIHVSGLTLRGRNSMCLNELVLNYAKTPRSAGEMCTQLKSLKKCQYFKNMADEARMNPILKELSRLPATAEIIFELAEAASVCPAETARKLMAEVDVIACSYLYLFDPAIRSSFLEQLGVDLDDLILIVDECHNLPDVAVEIGSGELSSFSFSRAIREAREERQTMFVPFFEACQELFTELTLKSQIEVEQQVNGEDILEDLELRCNTELDDSFFEDMVAIGWKIRTKLLRKGKEPRSSLGRIGEFFLSWYESIGRVDYIQSMEIRTFENDPSNRYAVLRLSSLDPRRILSPVLSSVYSSVHLTGTLGDADAYLLLTGLSDLQTSTIILPSPYDRKNIKAYYTQKLSTLYSHRSQKTYQKIAEVIAAVADATPKNVGVFAPSYSILEEILNAGLRSYVGKKIYHIPSDASSEENDRLIEQFKTESKGEGAILVSVLGGRSSEGTDFPGDMMNSVVVVGVPYAPPSPRINAKIEFLESNFEGMGKMLGYVIPAVNKASQAAGRAVRSLDDRAFILLVDFRYGSYQVKRNLPKWLQQSLEKIDSDPSIIEKAVRSFFSAT